jgi:hypothetical protein
LGTSSPLHDLFRTDGQRVAAPLPPAAPPILTLLAVWAVDGLVFDSQLELQQALNILRGAILVTFSHAKRVM